MQGKKLGLLALCAALLFAACAGLPQNVRDDLNSAKARADKARAGAQAAQAQVYFPNEWKVAETSYGNAQRTDTAKKKTAIEATGMYIVAAEGWEDIAEKSAPLFARDMNQAAVGMNAAKERAEKSRQDAQDSQAPEYLSDDWQAAESKYQEAEGASKKSPGEVSVAADTYTLAADRFDDVAKRSAAIAAQERDEAQKALQAAMARADKSRLDAAAVQAATYFADDWQAAETVLQTAKDSPKDTTAGIKSAAQQFVAAADAYDELAGKSQPLFARDEAARKAAAEKAAADARKALEDAQRALTAATARAEKSRQTAMDVDGPTYFANDWKNAESRLQAAKSARKTTAEEVSAATAQFNGAADAYDSIAGKARPMFTRDKDAASKALQAAQARAQQSRTAATNAGGQTLLPTDWRNAEAKNQSATNAKRGTTAEMNAAVTLYNAAADAYDDITKRSATGRDTAAAAVAKAKAKQQQSAALAASTGKAMEE